MALEMTDDAIAKAKAVLCARGWASRIPAAFREALLAEARWRFFSPGETVTLGGSYKGSFHAIGSGQVGVVAANSAPGTPMLFVMTAGWWWGAAPLAGLPRTIDGVARTQSSICSIPLSRIEALLSHNPAWWQAMALHTQEWLGVTTIAYVDMAVADTMRRCSAHLLRLAGLRPPVCPSVGEAIHLSHEEFGRMVNLSRSTTSSLLKRLERSGMIALGYRSITIRDPAALALLVETE